METQLKSLIEKYCLNSYLTDIQLDEIIDLALATKANPKEVEEYIQEKTEERKARIDAERIAREEAYHKAREEQSARLHLQVKNKKEELIVKALNQTQHTQTFYFRRLLSEEIDRAFKTYQADHSIDDKKYYELLAEERDKLSSVDVKTMEDVLRVMDLSQSEVVKNVEAERKKAKEAVLIKIVETSNSISLLLAQKFNEVINEVGTDHDAVKEYQKRMRKEALEAYMHRKDSPEAVERNRVLWAEYDKIVKAIQSGRVEIMDDLKRELDINLSNEAQKTDTISQNDGIEETERERLAAIERAKREKEEAERETAAKAEAERKAKDAIERAKREKEEAERQAKEEAERKAKDEAAKKAAAPSASISDVRIEKDVIIDGKLGIQVTAYIIINGMKGETAVVSVHNISELEQQVLTFTKKPVTVLNEVYQDKLTVIYSSAGWKEYKFFVSYESLLNTEEELDKTLHIVIRNGNEWNANILAQYKILYHIKYVTHIFRANEWLFTLKN